MIKPRKVIVVLLSAIAGLLLATARSTVPTLAQVDSFSLSFQGRLRRELSAEEKRGKAFYLRGERKCDDSSQRSVKVLDFGVAKLTANAARGPLSLSSGFKYEKVLCDLRFLTELEKVEKAVVASLVATNGLRCFGQPN